MPLIHMSGTALSPARDDRLAVDVSTLGTPYEQVLQVVEYHAGDAASVGASSRSFLRLV